MTIEKLNELGADTKTGLARCAGMEAFYLKKKKKSLRDTKYDELEGLIHEHKYNGSIYNEKKNFFVYIPISRYCIVFNSIKI